MPPTIRYTGPEDYKDVDTGPRGVRRFPKDVIVSVTPGSIAIAIARDDGQFERVYGNTPNATPIELLEVPT